MNTQKPRLDDGKRCPICFAPLQGPFKSFPRNLKSHGLLTVKTSNSTKMKKLTDFISRIWLGLRIDLALALVIVLELVTLVLDGLAAGALVLSDYFFCFAETKKDLDAANRDEDPEA